MRATKYSRLSAHFCPIRCPSVYQPRLGEQRPFFSFTVLGIALLLVAKAVRISDKQTNKQTVISLAFAPSICVIFGARLNKSFFFFEEGSVRRTII